MPAVPTIFYSNAVEFLYEHLSHHLFKKHRDPFSRRFVVIPNEAMKSWVSMRMAKDLAIGIAAGVEAVFLTNLMAKLTQKGVLKKEFHKERSLPTFLELSITLQVEIRRIVGAYGMMSFSERETWSPLLALLTLSLPKEGEEASWSKRSEGRLISLCERLAGLFFQYGLYGENMVDGWRGEQDLPWQEQLWMRVFSDESPYVPYFKELKSDYHPVDANQEIQIHLFVPGFLPKGQHHFFCHLAKRVPIYYYILSPCQLFWTDIRSDRESVYIREQWKKRGAPNHEIGLLEEFLRDRNPLLANLGRQGREFFSLLESGNPDSKESYALPASVKAIPHYQDFLWEEMTFLEEKKEASILDLVQMDILLLRNPYATPPMPLESYDRTIQVHEATSRWREVEILYDNVLGLMTDDASLSQEDIMVMAPNIEEYRPYIEMVFGCESSPFAIQILGLSLLEKAPFIQAFMVLLSLVEGRWDYTSLFQLFEDPYFQRKQQLSQDDVQQFRYWMKETGVRWGQDTEHRDEMLLRDFCSGGMVEKEASATWEHGMGQILMGFSTFLDEEEASDFALIEELPFANVDFSESDLLGKCMRLLRSLREDLRPLGDGTELSLKDWSAYLICLLDAYFSAAPSEKDARAHRELLVRKLESFSKFSEELSQERFSFPSLRCRLQSALKGEVAPWQTSRLNCLRFSSIGMMRAVPSKVIYLLGMDEGKFPRSYDAHALNLLKKDPRADYLPLPVDEDRYHFLETLLSARQVLIVSYVAKSQKDNEDLPPSLLLTELLNYLDRAFSAGNEPLSLQCVWKHPVLAFDRKYFSAGDDRYRSFSQPYYCAAKAHLGEKEDAYKFVPELFSSGKTALMSKEKVEGEINIDIRTLSQLVKNPLKSYFNHTLGIYLPDERDSLLRNEENFTLSALEHGIFRREALRHPPEEILARAQRRGLLPLGAFKTVALRRVLEEVERWKENLYKLGASPENIYTVEFRGDCREAARLPGGDWVVPSLRFPYRDALQVNLVGKLFDVTPQGLLAYGKDSVEDVLKVWPQFVLFSALSESFEEPLEKQLLLVKDGKCKKGGVYNSTKELCHLVDYYHICLENVSPLVPEWIEEMWKNDSKRFRKKVKTSLGGGKFSSYNEYLKRVMLGEGGPDDEVVALWRKVGHSVFSEMIKEWFPKVHSQEKGEWL